MTSFKAALNWAIQCAAPLMEKPASHSVSWPGAKVVAGDPELQKMVYFAARKITSLDVT